MSKSGLISSVMHSLHSTVSQEDKMQILNKYHKETSIKKIIGIAYNPWLDFGLQDFTPKHLGKKFGMGIGFFMHIIEDITQGKLDAKEAEFACRMAFMHINTEDAEVFLKLINQNLGQYLNLDVHTINSVWNELVMTYPLRQAQIKPIDNFDGFPASVQELSRGLRINIIVSEDGVSFRLKDGNEIDNFDIYKDQFLTLAQGQGTVFDGHAVVTDNNKIIATDNESVLEADPESIRFLLWDAIRYDGFINGEDTRIGYNWRYNGIEHMMLLALDKVENPCYDIIKAELVGSKDQLQATIDKHKKGCVVKSLDSIWKHGIADNEIICFP